MTIGIVTSYAPSQPAGLENFLLGLLGALDTSKKMSYVVYTKKGAGLRDALEKHRITHIPVVEVGFGKFWKDIGLFFQPRMDAYLFHGPMVPLCFAPKNYFVILHDLAYKYIHTASVREKLKRRLMDFLTQKALRRAKKVISASDATKRDLVRFFGAPPEKIETIYQGFWRIRAEEAAPVPGVKKPFFLFIGTLKERKNVLSILRAFAAYKKRHRDNRMLVLAGKHDHASPYVRLLHEEIAKRHIDESVLFTDHISDAQRAYLYLHADALVFPSLIEGFGIPILEAMSCGVPVLTSNAGALAEVAGGAALLVDPQSVDDIARGMDALASQNELREACVRKGMERIGLFDWSNAARALERLMIDASEYAF